MSVVRVLIDLELDLVSQVDALAAQRKKANIALSQATPAELQEAKKMCDKDGNTKRANLYLRECADKRRHAATSRHAICREALLLGFEKMKLLAPAK